ncbi:MAG: MerR family transcriptional regulator [Thermomicrobiales bacterium]
MTGSQRSRGPQPGSTQPRLELTSQELTVEIVAARAGVTVRRVQYLERVGLIAPVRESRSQRLYNDQAIERIQLIERLMVDLGVNLPGAEVILNMRERMLSLLDELNSTRRT